MSNKRRNKGKSSKPAKPDATPAKQAAQPNNSQPTARVRQVFSEEFQGPVPPPDYFAGYEAVLPGSADRIMSMAERQATHRQDLERNVVYGNSKREWVGLWLGFIIAVMFLVAAVWLVIIDHEVAGVLLGTVDIVALTGVFVYGRLEQRSERSAKRGALAR